MPDLRSRPHLVHVFYSFGVGGSQVRLTALINALGDRFSHTIVSLTGCVDALPLIEPGVDVTVAAPLPPTRGPLARLAQYRRRLDALKPDLLLTYNWGGMDFSIANIGRSTPHLHVEDGFGPEEIARQLQRRVLTRRLALFRSELVAPSGTLNDIATRMWKLDRRRVHWIPNGIAARDGWSTDLASLDLKLPAGLPIIAWVGALRPEKAPLRLLRAYAPVKDKAVLLIVGDGHERAEIEAEVHAGGCANVRLAGYRKDARDLIMQSDILALSSDTEQMPLAVLEAMDAGLPVVSTDVGDVRRMVAPINAPFVCSDEPALADALSALVADPDLRRRIGEANREKCRADYSLDGMIGAWQAQFDRLTA